MTVMTPYRSGPSAGRDGFAQVLHAEWTKFRTVRGWIIGALVGVAGDGGPRAARRRGGQSSCHGQRRPSP